MIFNYLKCIYEILKITIKGGKISYMRKIIVKVFKYLKWNYDTKVARIKITIKEEKDVNFHTL